jgi:His/Glu/Gln/Arg/opine family amino acid ABC transporter permease subunit
VILRLAALAACFALALLPARAENSLKEVQARGALVFGTDATYPPFEMKVGDRYEGFDIDIGTEAARELGVRASWQNINFDGIIEGLQTRKFDIVASSVSITAARKKEMAFSRPTFLAGQAIARRKGDERIRGRDDLRDKRVSVQLGTTGQQAVERLGLPVDHIRKFDTLPDALLDLRNGGSDATVGDQPALREMIRKGYPELELAGGVFVHESYALVLRRGEPELLAAVNKALDRIVADGRYARIYQRWVGEPLSEAGLLDLEAARSQGTSVQNGPAGSAFAIRWELLGSAFPLLPRGALTTLRVTFLALLIGIPAGLLLALARLSGIRALSLPATLYVEVIRGTPLLMQIFVIYFALPSVGISLPQMVAAITALSLNAAAYLSEIFRAGIESVDPGQSEAARSLGMDYVGTMRWVILPQTARRVLPPLTNEAVALLKDFSLISVIGLAELTRVGREQSSYSGSPVTIVLAVALLYLAMTLPLTHLVRRLEARWEPTSRRPRKGKGKKRVER